MIQLRGWQRPLRSAHLIGAFVWLVCDSALAHGSHLFDVRDETFAGPGKVGLWTKADSVTAFDGLEVEVLDEQREAS